MKIYLLLCFLLVTPADGNFTATLNGKLYAGKNNHATLNLNYARQGVNVLTIESFSSLNTLAAGRDENFIFLLTFPGKLPQKGTYVLQDMNFKKPFTTNTGTYNSGNPADSKYSFTPARGGSGSVIITAISDNSVSGTFSGTAVNSKKEKVIITNGVFSNLVIR